MKRAIALLCMMHLTHVMASQPRSLAPLVPETRSASEILWSIQKLGTLGRVLYVAAHPDDENTALISYLSLGGKYDTGYLSLTRGDGGQNLIGPELREMLGVIRTQELLAARKIDGGRQFFSRAKDFGYSKTAEETLRLWDQEEVLADMVWVIRDFQPDVIITRFGPEGGFTHGHHTASCLLALQAFEAAADPTRFPEQLERGLEPWQATRVVWNTSSWFFRRSGQSFDESEYVKLEVGGYDPLLGRSYNEIASLSRSQHRSQGFGTRIERGARTEHFQLLRGKPMRQSLFDDVITDWERVPSGNGIGEHIASIEASFNPRDPAASVGPLLQLRQRLAALDHVWAERKRMEVESLIASCLGLSLQAIAPEPVALPGQNLSVTIEALNRSPREVDLVEIGLLGQGDAIAVDRSLPTNALVEAPLSVRLPEEMSPSQPYWLERDGSVGMFDVADPSLASQPANPPPFLAELRLRVEGVDLTYRAPVVSREVDPAYGEILRPVAKALAASVSFDSPALLFSNHESRPARVTVSAPYAPVAGELELELPEGWSARPRRFQVDALELGASRSYVFEVQPPAEAQVAQLKARLLDRDGRAYDQSLKRIRYDHIPDQLTLEPAATKGISLEVAKHGERVAYLPGAGDAVPQAIEELGYEVTLLDPSRVDAAALEPFDALVLGIRAYNTIEEIDRLMPAIFDYVAKGGVAIAQYNTSQSLKTSRLAPFPLTLSRDRVTDENSAVRVLHPEHPALSVPNRISSEDFDGWVQERGLYFANQWDEAFTPLLAMADPGESPSSGSLLVARHGEGYFVYSGLSWFRQLPAGVPGAYRLFANLLSLGTGDQGASPR